MPDFSDSQLTIWANTYEREICAKHNFICDRISLEIKATVSQYELPNYITAIRSVLYQGKELHPKGFRASVLTGDTPFSTVGSIPYEYVFSGKGLRTIRFYPTPLTTLAAYVGNLWTPAADAASCIVEFYRTPILTDDTMRLPDWFRRYLLKDHVCWKAFSVEGPQQDARAAQYYQGRLAQQDMYLQQITTNLHAAQQYVLMETKMAGRRKPGRPVLPPTFGYKVNW